MKNENCIFEFPQQFSIHNSKMLAGSITIPPDGTYLELQRHDHKYVTYANGYDLMMSLSHGSEDEMISLACPRPRADACVLTGGLGMGYTLATTLNLLSPRGTVVVSELVPEVIDWNHGPLGPLAGHPLALNWSWATSPT